MQIRYFNEIVYSYTFAKLPLEILMILIFLFSLVSQLCFSSSHFILKMPFLSLE